MTSKIKVDNISDQNDNNIINESGDVITVGAAGDTVAVAGNIVKSNAYQASDGGNIASQSGTTITLGASGDTVTLASGASQSGFGRTGTVDWQTTPKTGNFTAANGEGYFINTTSGAVTMTMPAGSAGAIVSIQDYNKTFDSNSLTITPASGEKINGGIADGDLIVNTEGQGLTFVYVDATVGWKTVHENEFTQGGASFMIATGGTITTCGNDKIHTFTGPGTFTVCTVAGCASNNLVSYLVVAGGGGSGKNRGGGGGAGGFREVVSPSSPYTGSPLNGYPSSPNRVTVTATAFPITVGGGGAGVPSPSPDTNLASKGVNSVFSTITSTGGGGAGSRDSGSLQPAPAVPTASGGSGGGHGSSGPSGATPGSNNGGSGNTPPVSPSQGSDGGSNGRGSPYSGGTGGGGATVQGSPQNITIPTVPGSTNGQNRGAAINDAGGLGGDGGQGATTSITGSAVGYAGGGAGGGSCNPSVWSPNASLGGTGGIFGNPATGTTPLFGGGPGGNAGIGGNSGTTNRGGGGGGGGGGGAAGANGGSGVVIIRYKFQ